MPALPYVANVVISGVLTGTVYGLMALGLSAIFGVVRLVNFAHGELMTLAMYGAVAAFQGLALDPFLTMILAAVAFGVCGYFLQRGFINRFIHRPEHVQMLLGACAGNPTVAKRFANGFSDPNDFGGWLLSPELADAYLASVA